MNFQFSTHKTGIKRFDLARQKCDQPLMAVQDKFLVRVSAPFADIDRPMRLFWAADRIALPTEARCTRLTEEQ